LNASACDFLELASKRLFLSNGTEGVGCDEMILMYMSPGKIVQPSTHILSGIFRNQERYEYL
jgi:hypothetical protein